LKETGKGTSAALRFSGGDKECVEMLALLTFLQNLVGRRTLLVMVVLAAVSIIGIEFTNVARNFYETSNQKQIAEQAAAMQLALQQEKTALAIKAAEDAKRAAFDAKTAEAIARESALRQEAERREKQALADKADADRRTAEAVARESALRQEAERREKEGLAQTATAAGNNADRLKAAEAQKLEAEAAYQTWLTEAITGRRVATKDDDAAAHKNGEFLVYEGLSFTLGRHSAERAANDRECRQSCLNKTNFTCVGGTFFRESQSCTLYEKMNVQSVVRDPDAVGFVRTNTEVIEVVGAVVQPKRGVAPARAQNASAASDTVGRRMYERNLCAADRLMGHTSITDGVGCHEKPDAPQPAPPRPIAAAPSPAAMQSARMPPAFHCSNAFFGVEFVICSSPQLVEAEARLEDAARAARGNDVKTDQRAWYTKIFVQSCGLTAKGRPSPDKIRASQNCVAEAISQRIHALETVTAQRQAE
jgi:chemotaxis protein histidine kinase CheA